MAYEDTSNEGTNNVTGETPIDPKSADLLNKVKPIKSKDWESFSVWRVMVMRGSLIVSYSGNNGGMIFCNKKALENVFNSVNVEKQFNKEGKQTYHFQDVNFSYVSRVVSNQGGSTAGNKVSFKFLRVSYAKNKCVLYQNSFEILDNLRLGQNVQSIMIEMTIEQFLSPFSHIAVQTKSNKTDSGDIGEIDID